MFDKVARNSIIQAAWERGLDPAAVLAVAEVESGGRALALVEGRLEPLIRWEGHYFHRRLPSYLREVARANGLSHPQAGAIPNPPDQPARWRLLKRAEAMNRDAAWESTSWGIGQVMGASWRRMGYRDVAPLVAEAREGILGQARLMTCFIAATRLNDPLEREDWAAFACGYNGPNYRQNAYDTKLEQSFKRHAPDTPLFPGAIGARVRRLQTALAGYHPQIKPDGRFGPLTEAALFRFQAEKGLKVDGIAGPQTFRALGVTG